MWNNPWVLFSVSAVLSVGTVHAQPPQQTHPEPAEWVDHDRDSDIALVDIGMGELLRNAQNAVRKGHWAEAHAAFLAAWGLKRQYQIAGNLGAAEMKIGRYRDAAEHLAFYLREAPKDKGKERQSVQALLMDARKQVGALIMKVEPAGAEVLVDGVAIGKAPVGDEVFVDPGVRAIEARAGGYETATVRVDIAAGGSREVALVLVTSAVKMNEAAVTNGNLTGTRETTSNTGAGREDGVTGRGQSASTSKAGGRSRGLIITGAATSAALVGAGIVFVVLAGGKASERQETREMLRKETGRSGSCWEGSSAVPAGCEELRDVVAKEGVYGSLAFWTILTGSALGAGTAIYALTGSNDDTKKGLSVTSVVTSRGGGVVLTGSW